MTIDGNMIEVNEITDYWSFLMSVRKCRAIILKYNIKHVITFYADRMEGPVASWTDMPAHSHNDHGFDDQKLCQSTNLSIFATV